MDSTVSVFCQFCPCVFALSVVVSVCVFTVNYLKFVVWASPCALCLSVCVCVFFFTSICRANQLVNEQTSAVAYINRFRLRAQGVTWLTLLEA